MPRFNQQETIGYYDANAAAYFEQTAHLDMTATRRVFTTLLPSGARVLDAGCGSGRDARVFLDDGFEVTAIDASRGMAEQAQERLGIEVEVMRFEEMTFQDEFDGIWACASFLHVPASDLPHVLHRMFRALKPGGILYLSFKKGVMEEWREGRLFRDLTEQGLLDLLGGLDGWNILELWETTDGEDDRDGIATAWLNCLVKRG